LAQGDDGSDELEPLEMDLTEGAPTETEDAPTETDEEGGATP
jgi:hypothetical protein